MSHSPLATAPAELILPLETHLPGVSPKGKPMKEKKSTSVTQDPPSLALVKGKEKREGLSKRQIDEMYVVDKPPAKEYRMCWLVSGGDPAFLPEIKRRSGEEDEADKFDKDRQREAKAAAKREAEEQARMIEQAAPKTEPKPRKRPEKETPSKSGLVKVNGVPTFEVGKPKKTKAASPTATPSTGEMTSTEVQPSAVAVLTIAAPLPGKKRYETYLRGFGEGASNRKKSREDTDYLQGYEDGHSTRDAMSDMYADKIGYKPSILKVQDLD